MRILIAVVFMCGVLGCVIPTANAGTPGLDAGTATGGDSDRHGCKASAGYSWCETKGKCVRPWEEKCSSP